MIAVTVCEGCALGRAGFAAPLWHALDAAGIAATVAGVPCMSGCARPSTVAFRAEGKVAYLFGDLGPEDLEALVAFAHLYDARPDGTFEDARVLGDLRHRALARIPG